MFKINKRIGRPQSLLNLLSRAHPQGSFHQQTQQRPGLRREPDAQPLPPQFAAKGIQLEESKMQGAGTEGDHNALLAIEQPLQEGVLTQLTAALGSLAPTLAESKITSVTSGSWTEW